MIQPTGIGSASLRFVSLTQDQQKVSLSFKYKVGAILHNVNIWSPDMGVFVFQYLLSLFEVNNHFAFSSSPLTILCNCITSFLFFFFEGGKQIGLSLISHILSKHALPTSEDYKDLLLSSETEAVAEVISLSSLVPEGTRGWPFIFHPCIHPHIKDNSDSGCWPLNMPFGKRQRWERGAISSFWVYFDHLGRMLLSYFQICHTIKVNK